jgi:hypothetical protein
MFGGLGQKMWKCLHDAVIPSMGRPDWLGYEAGSFRSRCSASTGSPSGFLVSTPTFLIVINSAANWYDCEIAFPIKPFAPITCVIPVSVAGAQLRGRKCFQILSIESGCNPRWSQLGVKHPNLSSCSDAVADSTKPGHAGLASCLAPRRAKLDSTITFLRIVHELCPYIKRQKRHFEKPLLGCVSSLGIA